MVSVHLYGKLRRYAEDQRVSSNSIIAAEVHENETLIAFLTRLGLDVDELYTIFVNGRLLTSRTSIAPFLGYQQVCDEDCQNWSLNVIVRDGDRIGLFGKDMPALVA